MTACIRKGDLAGGLALFVKSVPFPRVISRICDRPCESTCKRREVGEPIHINLLERACVEWGGICDVHGDGLPTKEKRVAVVGAGLSGLAAATNLAMKGYQVVLFEARARLGGRCCDFPETVLPRRMLEDDLKVLQQLSVEVRCNSAVGNDEGAQVRFAALLNEFDAVYVGPGTASMKHRALGLALGEDERIQIAPRSLATSEPKVFAGGGQRWAPNGFSPITSLQDGHAAAVSIDRYLQKVSLTASREKEGPQTTRLFTSLKGIEPLPAVQPADPRQGYTEDEAQKEAQRCIDCQCLECVKACEFLAHYGAYPKRYVREIFINDSIVQGEHHSNRMVNTCALCGLCAVLCPDKLDMATVCLEARQSLVTRGKMPASAHDFALRDMAFSHSEQFALARHAPHHSSSATLFFPGCQLCASSPEQVVQIYHHLRERLSGGVGLHLGCCGAPAEWAGRQELFEKTLGELAETWKGMGSPRVVTACASCHRVFKDRMPGVAVESLWTVLAEHPVPQSASAAVPRALAVHDPCVARGDGEVQDAVRKILTGVGVRVEELPHTRALTTCCGYGGLMSAVNPEVADKVVKRRVEESATDYVAYCAMCRDNFSAKGKRTVHILDLLCPSADADPAARKGPTFSQRQENRARLKARLLRELWGETLPSEGPRMEVIISPEVLALMEKRAILVADVERAVAHAEESQEKFKDSATGHFIASHSPVSVTYWVEYSVDGDRFVVHNAYSHRMKIG
jgi:Fe-S oxidoreductase